MSGAITGDTLERFHDGQCFVYETALAEMKQGRKTCHWIWFIFPQMKGLGHSWQADYYGISDLREAKAYLADPILGPRLRRITEAVLSHSDIHVVALMGSEIDALKLRSSMTLFYAASPDDIFGQVLDLLFYGERDQRSLELIFTNKS